MNQTTEKNEVIRQLQREVLSLQGHRRPVDDSVTDTGLGPMKDAFPDKVFPTGAIHEFLSFAPEDAAATDGFIAGLLGRLMRQGLCLWIGSRHTIFPPALSVFGIAPDRIVFVDLARPKDILWAIEEALKCEVLSAVVGQLSELGFTESRRLQLAVEQSRVTGFIHRYEPRNKNTVACLTRWEIKSLASEPLAGMPGVGHPRWHVRLLKVRNGRPGSWDIEWSAGRFRYLSRPLFSISGLQNRKAG